MREHNAAMGVPVSQERAVTLDEATRQQLLALIEGDIDEPLPSTAREHLEAQKGLVPDSKLSGDIPQSHAVVAILLPVMLPVAAVANIGEALRRRRMRKRFGHREKELHSLVRELRELQEAADPKAPYRTAANPRLATVGPMAKQLYDADTLVVVSYTRASRYPFRARYPIEGLAILALGPTGAAGERWELVANAYGYNVDSRAMPLLVDLRDVLAGRRPAAAFEYWGWNQDCPETLKPLLI